MDPYPEYLAYLYNNLTPGKSFELDFEEDGRWDSNRNDFRSKRWNWSSTNFKGFTGLLSGLRAFRDKKEFSFDEFEDFYEEKVIHRSDILKNLQRRGLVESPFRMAYTFKYRADYLPALLLRIEKIEWRQEEHKRYPIYITFVPDAYFIVDARTWRRLDR